MGRVLRSKEETLSLLSSYFLFVGTAMKDWKEGCTSVGTVLLHSVSGGRPDLQELLY